MPNIALLDQVLQRIEEDPDSWDQSHYAKRTDCGTAFCVAGWVVELTKINVDFRWDVCTDGFGPDYANTLSDKFGNFAGSIDAYAEKELGITSFEADILFAGSNTFEEVKGIRDALAEGLDFHYHPIHYANGELSCNLDD